MPPIDLTAIRLWLWQVGRGASRLLNALTGGEGDVTYSARSWQLYLQDPHRYRWRVRLVDWLNGDPQHCMRAYYWHLRHGLIGPEGEGD